MTDQASPGRSAGDSRFADVLSGTPGSTPEPWYRSKRFLVGAAVVAILAVTVITDLPAPASRASNVSAATSVITTINTDLAPCYFAASEAVAYQEVAVRGTTTAAQRAQAPRLLNDDLIACSLVNSSVFDLANIDVPGSATAKQLASMLDDSTTWAVRDAHDTIAEIQILEAHPNSPGALAALRVDLGLMATDRASAAASRASAASLLDAKLPALLLPAVGSASAVLGAP